MSVDQFQTTKKCKSRTKGNMNSSDLLTTYSETLLINVIPFWVRHGIDPNGGINTCIRDDGTIVNRDRWSWSQWRALWVFSKLYRSIERRRQWLDIARGIYDFTTSHGPLDSGHWPLLLGGDGTVKRGYDSIYTDAFAILGLVEYGRVAQDVNALALAMDTFHTVERSLAEKTELPAWPYPIPSGCMPHGLSMIFSLAYHELAQATNNASVRAAAIEHHSRVMQRFLRPNRGIVLEWLNRDGSEPAPPLGTVICPGHAVESMWFQIHIAQTTGDQATIRTAIEAIRLHLEKGWDAEYGGLFLAIDANGCEKVHWPHADMKLWWPHTEALYATLLAYELTGESWCLEWHQRIHDYSFSHYPVEAYGEWRQRLDRRGRPVNTVVALPVKDPFHLPRALIYCIEVLKRLEFNCETSSTKSNR